MVAGEELVTFPAAAAATRGRFWKFAHALEIGPSQIISPTGEWLPLIRRLPVASAKRIALSFDDGPTVHSTRAIVNLLHDYHAKATFFLSGERVAENPDLAELLVEAGHDVFGHGWEHVRYKTPEQVIANIDRVERLLQEYRSTPRPYLVRLPYAEGRRIQWVHRAIRQWNPAAQVAYWTHCLEDWEIPAMHQARAGLEAACSVKVDALMARPDLDGAIILLHEDAYDVASPLAKDVAPVLLENLLKRFSNLGFTFSPIIPWKRRGLKSRFILY